MLDLGKEIIFFRIVCLFWNLFLFGMRLFFSSVIRMRSEFFFYHVFLGFWFFRFGCWEKWGTRKKTNKKIPDFSRFTVLIFLELFYSRKTKNLLKNIEEKENELLIERVLQVIFFSILKKMRDERMRVVKCK